MDRILLLNKIDHNLLMNSSNVDFISMPQPYNLQKSIPFMTIHQLQRNLVETNLKAFQSDQCLQSMVELMKDPLFYYQNRYVLFNIYSNSKQKGIIHRLKEIQEKFDNAFVNGPLSLKDLNINQIQQHAKQKQIRLQVINFRRDFINLIDKIGQHLQTLNTKEQKQSFFSISIQQLNLMLVGKETYSNKNQSNTILLDQSKPYQFLEIRHKDNWMPICQVLSDRSFFIKTKNRHPLVLNFQFARYIFKNDNQLTHQIIAMELIKFINMILPMPLIVQYNVNPLSVGALYEFVQQSSTVGGLKRDHENLVNYFNKYQCLEQVENKGLNGSPMRRKFAETYAGFCLIQYVLQLKDRNNENIMIKKDGSIFHIDLAFIFQSSPGKFGFQSAPFKMTKQYIQILGSFDSDYFKYFQSLLIQSFTKLHIHRQEFLYKISILKTCPQIKCFQGFTLSKYQQRFNYNLNNVTQFIQNLIDESNDSWTTKKYDQYQFKTNGILP